MTPRALSTARWEAVGSSPIVRLCRDIRGDQAAVNGIAIFEGNARELIRRRGIDAGRGSVSVHSLLQAVLTDHYVRPGRSVIQGR